MIALPPDHTGAFTVNYRLQQELFSRLAMLDEHITQSERNVACQRRRVDVIRRVNGDVSFSFALLQTFEESLVLRYLTRERVVHDLEAAHRYPRHQQG
jgi:hypothetical protein